MMTIMEEYRIVIADDHALFRKGLKRVLEGHDNIRVVGEAGDGLELLDLVKHVAPHMAIIDISMPKIRGIEAAHEIEKLHPAVKVLILTMHKDLEYLKKAILAGAEGYILKEHLDTELFPAIQSIMDGGVHYQHW